MQIVAVPLFSKEMTVEAYMIRYLKENNLFSTAQATNLFDGASRSDALEVLDLVGLESFTLNKPLFVPINELMLMGNLETQCREPADKIIFVFEKPLAEAHLYLPIVERLRGLGYRFAANYPYDFENEDPVMAQCSYIFLSQREERRENTEQVLKAIKKKHKELAPIASHIYDEQTLKSLYRKGYVMYESRFYRVQKSKKQIGPAKTSAIQLINTVQDENFDFEEVTSIVMGDPVLTVSLLQMVNTNSHGRNEIKTIAQAVSMMGQQEVRKWVTTAVSASLGEDRPNEITRRSLLRAKFAENLAPLFDMTHLSSELFLTGLFSVLDVILEQPMADALEMVKVSDIIRDALLTGSGQFAQVLKLVTDYENANWSAVSRAMIVHDMADATLAKAYLDALLWYRDLISFEVSVPEEEPENAEETASEAVAEEINVQ